MLKFRLGVPTVIFLLFVLPCAWVPCAYVFFSNENVSVTLCGLTAAAAGMWGMTIPPLLRGVFRATSVCRNLCSRGPRGLKFFMHSHPLMGGRPPKFQQKIRRKKFFFFRLISPTHFPAYNSCSTCTRCLKFVMRIDSPHAGPTITFLFQNSTKIVHFFGFFKNIY